MYESIMKNPNIENVFFDIFDTILSRKVQPEYVKKIWANNIVKTFDLKMTCEELYLIRNKTELSEGEKNLKLGKDNEFIYKEMIEKLYTELNNSEIQFDYFYKICEETEIEIESNVLYCNDDILNLIKKLNKKNKKIYCVSDMYLSKKMIIKIFKKLNIIDYFTDFFVSCDYLVNKKTGKLYQKVIEKINAKPESCFMIGDNEIGDYKIPKSMGITSYLLNRKDKYNFYNNFIIDNNEDTIIKKYIELTKTKTNNFEHCIFSLYNFIEKIYYKLIKENKNEVFFLSREGEYLKQLFDYYVENTYNKKIQSYYLYVSRKSTYLPSLKKITQERFDILLNQYSYITTNEFLKSLNFNEKEIAEIGKVAQNFDFNKKINNFKSSDEFKNLLKNKMFIKIYEENRITQKNNFIKYIKDKTDSKQLYVVDIGWNGSIQNNIQNILGTQYKVVGLYFGLQKKYFNEKDEKYGLIFTNYPTENKEYYLYSENRSIFEIILGASHGSANKYIIKNNKVNVELFKKQEEEDIFINVIKPIQEEMFKTFKLLTHLLENRYYDNKKIYLLSNKLHFEMIFSPTKEQFNFFNKIYHYENFGVFQFNDFKLKQKLSLKQWIKENIEFIRNRNSYVYDSFWPISKLYNNKLYLIMFIYKYRKKKRFKKSNII